MVKIRINERRSIGDGEPVFIIAEAGANHNRDKKLAFELIDAAVDAKADAVKFQIYSAETLYSKKTPRRTGRNKTPWETIKEVETPRDWIPELKQYCDSQGIIFFATPFDEKAVEELHASNVELFKVASFEIVDLLLLKSIAEKQKPIIISTGLANMEEIEDAFVTCKAVGNVDIVLLQCASIYPAQPEIMNMNSMATLRKAFGVLTGLSDHTLGTHIPVAATGMGASVIEKHFTISRKLEGPDHPFAVEPGELHEMIKNIRDVEKAMGDGTKFGPSSSEIEAYNLARRSIHANVSMKSGETITFEKLAIKRPGLGIKPKYLDIVLGKKINRDVEQDEWITWDMIG